ncbi:Xaa-Pro dipeptidase [Marinobacter daepoensis]|uniref:Xaa-Pro dipeptidase n=1 Tax=Marinobacter daepoensis TaxID=262077 RepID=A0ABS3B9R2_9GAMM|nr:Xaa-Pro dipeptidase [Marinobacter daepoensis]MBN7768594.1 Xaa-Pro dipeptidase [Marinobacter daepoensis]MBY6079331.1 Xaa-Pro dipeptidase [Marinobacter daepoensis]
MSEHELLTLQSAHIQELQRRYERALADHGYDSVLIASGAAPYRYRDDQTYVFQGFGPFLHWTGLAGQEHSWLLIRPGHKPVLWLFQPVDFWHASPDLPAEPWQEAMEVRSRQQAGAPELANTGRLAVLGDPQVLEGVPGDHNPSALVAATEETRVHKTCYEIECLAHANRVALKGHKAAREAFLAGGSEFGISLAYQQATGQREALAPYHSIIGLNEHAGTLHYQYYEGQVPRQHRSLLIDAGVRYRGYCSDITRTVAAPGEPRFAALVHGLEQLQLRLCEMVVPGMDYVEIHRKTHQGIAALLSASGLVTGLSDDAMVAQGITRAFFPHGIGHFLGIQVHDVAGKPTPPPEDAPFLRLTRTLEDGMVVTIEPGLYFIPSLLGPMLAGPQRRYLAEDLINDLKGCGGIRIEDNVAVTASGARNLTRELA